MTGETKEILYREDLLFELLIFILYNVDKSDDTDYIISQYREAWSELKFSWE